MTDPFATSTVAPGPNDQDEFDAPGGFVRAEHLVGCLLLITCTGPHGKRPSTTQAGKEYDWVQVDTVVLAGEPNRDKVPAGPLPLKLDGMQFSGSAIVPDLRGKIGKERNKVLGRMIEFPSKANPRVPGYRLVEPNDEDRALARDYLARERARAATADPFAAPVG